MMMGRVTWLSSSILPRHLVSVQGWMPGGCSDAPYFAQTADDLRTFWQQSARGTGDNSEEKRCTPSSVPGGRIVQVDCASVGGFVSTNVCIVQVDCASVGGFVSTNVRIAQVVRLNRCHLR
jgi:hypothetical protein